MPPAIAAWIVAHAGLVAQALALAGGLLLSGVVLRLRPPADGRARAHVGQDLAHVAFRAAVLLPTTALALGALDDAVTQHAPMLRVDLLGALPAPARLVAWIVLADLLDYAIHRAFHASPWLWEFHAVHHSQTWVNPLTTTRTHPVEILVKRVVTWGALLLFGGPDHPWAVWVALDGFWGFFVHSGLRTTLGPLGWLVVSPHFHALHHSSDPAHRDVNFGERLALWDTLFGTAKRDVEVVRATGVADPSYPVETEGTLGGIARAWWAQLVYPFVRLAGRRRPSVRGEASP